MLHIYIADTDLLFIENARQALGLRRSVGVVGTASNGALALQDIIRLKPDLLLTDIQLPGMDGIALLRETRRMSRPPSVIVCTRFYSGASMERAFKSGASYFLCKPINYAVLPDLMIDCARSGREERAFPRPVRDDERRRAADIRMLISELGISPKLNGSAYLLECIQSAQRDQTLLRNLSQGLYVDLATRLNTTASRVERSLRSAIAIGYERGAMADIFSHRPTNKEFIEYLLRVLDAPGEPPIQDRSL